MNLIIINSDKNHAPFYHNNFLNNFYKKKLNNTFLAEKKFKHIIFQLNKLHNYISENLKNIHLDNQYNSILSLPKDELCIYLYNQCHINAEYDNKFLKILINLSSKFKNNHEILMLIRYLIDNVSSEICFALLIYNALLKSIYCDYGAFYEVYERKDFYKYRRNFRDSLCFLKKDEKHFFNYYYYNRQNAYLNPNNVVWPLIKVLGYCRFFDLHKRDCYGVNSNFQEDENLLKLIKQDLKIKYIGEEKWKNQLALYKNTKFIFKDTDIKVLREYSPRFLGRQRLDVYFEIQDKKIAFEYQGEQHFKPVDFFGGINAYEKRKKLDKIKKEKCKRNSINLIEFNYTDSVSINSILEKLQKKNINLKGDNHVPNV